jgi:CD109 antigen
MSRLRLVAPIVAVSILLVVLAACGAGPAGTATTTGTSVFRTKVDGFVASVPSVLRSGETASFAFTLTNGTEPARSLVKVSVLDASKTLASTSGDILGTGTLALQVPVVTPGDYQVKVEGSDFSKTAAVRIEAGTMLFLETDKPIYKPGQTVQMRLVALDSELKPVETEAVVEIQDAKGVKVSKQTLTTDKYGTATAQLPLSTEPNLGVWKLTATAGDASTQLDVRVEKYVLPKYEVKATLTKDWFLVDEAITGHVSATYSYGRAVGGELKITAWRYVGEWEEYATYSGAIDGDGDFKIQAAGYVAGVPEAGGDGNVKLEISVVEKATGYEQSTTELVTVADSPLTLQLIPENAAFKPTLPFSLLIVSKTPGGDPVEAKTALDIYYYDENYAEVGHETDQVETRRGTGLVQVTPPTKAVRMSVVASSGDAYANADVAASYSPSGSFVHVQQEGDLALAVGDTASFHVTSTARSATVYYEVVARGQVVFSSSAGNDISFKVTPAMAPSSRLLVYQILPSSEVAADSLPFDVHGDYPQQVSASFNPGQAKPGDKVEVDVQTEGPAKVGLVAVDHSVFILAENRLNLEQVFAELEQLYMQPQAELHSFEPMGGPITIPGAEDTFKNSGLIVLSNKSVPQGKQLENPVRFAADAMEGAGPPMALAPGTTAAMATTTTQGGATGQPATGDLAEVERVRQYFPETWIWDETLTDASGKAKLTYDVPDSITTWDLRAVALSPDKGLGIAETSLVVFQPFFLQADLPYSAIRGEEFPLKVAVYNYLDKPQTIQVQIEPASWFDLLDGTTTTITVAAGDIGSAQFRIRPKTIGTQLVKVTARSSEAADAVLKSMIVEPEGVGRETVENAVVPAGQSRVISLPLPDLLQVVPDSQRAYVAVTGSLLAQTIQGLDQLLQMPFGCGEQNMILFAPDAFILKYLKSTQQLKPEVQAKAEMLLITGYQRELTYRHNDGSFSAFGEQDDSGSLWLTAFVLKTFAQAKKLTYIDETVLSDAARWITSHQAADGSFESVGFICHEDMMGGVQGKDALTAYVAISLLEAGYTDAAGKAIRYLEGRLGDISDPYGLALTTYALELGKSGRAGEALEALMALAVVDENGLHWNGGGIKPLEGDSPQPLGGPQVARPGGLGLPVDVQPGLDVEATGYGTLALIVANDRVNAAQAAKWLVGQRNSQGGFGSTQDTVVALQALTEFATLGAGDTQLTVTVKAGSTSKTVKVGLENFDVTQVIEVPAGVPATVSAEGKGQAVVQEVLRYNLPTPEKTKSVFDIKVDYDTAQVEVNDQVDVKVKVTFNPPEPVKAGMVVLDVSVPTGFAAVDDSLAALLDRANIKRYDVAGRKVIVYLEDMNPGDTVSFSFKAVALYPVRAKGAASTVYAYYTPDWRGETVSAAVDVQ